MILIATPTDGSPSSAVVTYGYHQAVRAAEALYGAEILPSSLAFSDDLVKARSRAVWHALQDPRPWDYLLWWDDDVVPRDLGVIGRMAATGHDVIGCPYPRKRIPAQIPFKPLERHLKEGVLPFENGCLEVEYLAIGFMLTSRACLQMMVRAYEADCWWTDNHPGFEQHETVAIFRQITTHERLVPDGKGGEKRFRALLGEDYSFCHRWRALGGTVNMWVADGPAAHIGMHQFQGEIADLGRLR